MTPPPIQDNLTAQTSAASAVSEVQPFSIKDHTIGLIYKVLDTTLGDRLSACGRPGHRPADIEGRLMQSATRLYEAGFDSPDKAQNHIRTCWHHDAALAMTGGSISSNIGYVVGMNAGSAGFADKLPKEVLSNGPLLGLVLGLAVGAIDVMCNMVGGGAVDARTYNPRCKQENFPPSYPAIDTSQRFIDDLLRSTAANVIKNSTRMVAPGIQYAVERGLNTPASEHQFINTATHDQFDLQLDGVGGFVSNAYAQYKKLDPGPLYVERLLLRSDLDQVLAKSKESVSSASWDAVKGGLQGLKDTFTSVTPSVLAGTIGAFIGMLFAGYRGIEQNGSTQYADQHNSTIRNTTGHNDTDLIHGVDLFKDNIHVMTAVQKRSYSTAMMGLMSASIPMVATVSATQLQPVVDRVFDALSTRLAQWSANVLPRQHSTTSASAMALVAARSDARSQRSPVAETVIDMPIASTSQETSQPLTPTSSHSESHRI